MKPGRPIAHVGSCSSVVIRVLIIALCLATGTAARAAPPRLVVVVAIDQFPQEYLDRYRPLFGPDGFNRLMNGGADYVECHYGHFITATGPGHAVMLTGSDPVHNGIVGNAWFDRVTGAPRGCVEDARFPIVGSEAPEPPGAGVSPLALASPTVGDGLRLATGLQAKVIAASIKDRGAVLMGGWRPTAAYWFDSSTCRFVSSTYYMERLPEWAARFDAAQPCRQYLGRPWKRQRNDPAYLRYADVDDAPYEADADGLGRTFPHPVKEGGQGTERFAAVVASPYGNDLLLRFAEAAVDGEQLGRDAVPDLLLLSLSSNDYVGHSFGPHSQEVLDMTVRTDAQLAELMRFLDRKIGRGQWLLVLTSDHGVAPVPEYLEKVGFLPARPDHYRFDLKAARERVEHALTERFFDSQPAPEGFPGFFVDWGGQTDPFVWINAAAGKQLPKPLTYGTLLAAVKEEIGQVEGVSRVFAVPERAALAASLDPFDRRAYRTWQLPNGGDLLVQLAPYWLPSGHGAGTTHFTPYEYDTHVPLLLYGPGIRPGRYDRSVEVVDLAPTLAEILAINAPPLCTGEVLREAVR